MDRLRLDQLVAGQEGVVSRSQALGCGLNDNDFARLVRRREWARVHEGVYVAHIGPLTWVQRAWAAILFCWPAALAGRSALRMHGVRSESAPLRTVSNEPIHVVVEHRRRVIAPAGVVLTRRVGFLDLVQANLSPPRLRIEDALLDVASEARTEREAVAVLADACQQGRTTADRLRQALAAAADCDAGGCLSQCSAMLPMERCQFWSIGTSPTSNAGMGCLVVCAKAGWSPATE